MRFLLFALAIVVGSAYILAVVGSFEFFPEATLERDAEFLAELIAERIFCDIAVPYRGFDTIAGNYDSEEMQQQKFKKAYDIYFALASNRISDLTTEQKALLCENLELSEQSGT